MASGNFLNLSVVLMTSSINLLSSTSDTVAIFMPKSSLMKLRKVLSTSSMAVFKAFAATLSVDLPAIVL